MIKPQKSKSQNQDFKTHQVWTRTDPVPIEIFKCTSVNVFLEIAAYEVQNRELGANTDLLERKTKIAPQCPWCKITKVGGFNAIICSVWPGHNALEHHTKHLGSNEDEWRGIDLAREPVDVFDMDRYLDEKAYLAAKDPFRMTTPVSDKIDKWRAKYGTKP